MCCLKVHEGTAANAEPSLLCKSMRVRHEGGHLDALQLAHVLSAYQEAVALPSLHVDPWVLQAEFPGSTCIAHRTRCHWISMFRNHTAMTQTR